MSFDEETFLWYEAEALAACFPGQPDKLRAFLRLSFEEQKACFPGRFNFDEHDGQTWGATCERALQILEGKP